VRPQRNPDSDTSRRAPRGAEKTAAPAKEAAERYAELFSALSDPIRVRMIQMLGSSRERVPCALFADVFGIGKSTISYHVKILWNADLIKIEKEGRAHFYTLRENVLATQLRGILGRASRRG
jgi:DNA-binding transcriptional ArsR family regulator